MINRNNLTTEDVIKFDEWAVDIIGLPSIVLMENAGKSVADEIYNSYFAKDKGYDGVTIFCGTGRNGGDGLVCARHLFVKGVAVNVFIVGGVSSFGVDSELNFRILRKLGVNAYPLLSERDLAKAKIPEKHIIIDAVFGVGVNRPIIGFFRKAVDKINDAKNLVISVDVPSGFNIDEGTEWGACVRANKTITMVGPKKGFSNSNATELIGKVVVVDLGIDNILGLEDEPENEEELEEDIDSKKKIDDEEEIIIDEFEEEDFE